MVFRKNISTVLLLATFAFGASKGFSYEENGPDQKGMNLECESTIGIKELKEVPQTALLRLTAKSGAYYSFERKGLQTVLQFNLDDFYEEEMSANESELLNDIGIDEASITLSIIPSANQETLPNVLNKVSTRLKNTDQPIGTLSNAKLYFDQSSRFSANLIVSTPTNEQEYLLNFNTVCKRSQPHQP